MDNSNQTPKTENKQPDPPKDPDTQTPPKPSKEPQNPNQDKVQPEQPKADLPPTQPQPQPSERPAEQVYALNMPESQMLVMLQQNTQAIMSSVLSFIASQRLGYPLTQQTQFRLIENFTKLAVSEALAPQNPPAPQQPQNPPQNPQPPANPVKPAT